MYNKLWRSQQARQMPGDSLLLCYQPPRYTTHQIRRSRCLDHPSEVLRHENGRVGMKDDLSSRYLLSLSVFRVSYASFLFPLCCTLYNSQALPYPVYFPALGFYAGY